MPKPRNDNTFGVAYEVVGHGPALLLHPGMFQVGSHWQATGCPARLAATHTVITVDPLGLGASSAPPDPESYSLAKRVHHLTAVLDELGVAQTAFWGYSLGALTGYGMAIHAPHRLTHLVAGGFDPICGFRSAIDSMLSTLDLPAGTDPFPIMEQGARTHPDLASVIERADPIALRANFQSFSTEPAVKDALAQADIPMLLYAGTADPWHEPMARFAELTAAPFISLPGADHIAGWHRSPELVPRVSEFLATT